MAIVLECILFYLFHVCDVWCPPERTIPVSRAYSQ
jgi:hypothetical protein